ncbi:MAG TPA: GNAT family N-acetyltransferase [Deltaproteobacteria bacterium]|nr:GNAT family N-acetyltransferase [Deltaproteobacteria bacterium]
MRALRFFSVSRVPLRLNEMELLVRPARPGDGAAMAEIFVEAARTAWAHFLPPTRLALLRSPAERWERGGTDEVTLVAEQAGQVVAFAVVRRSDDADADPLRTGELDTFYALPSRWGCGVGQVLLGAALEALRAGGYREATLWTAEQNERPRRIYEAAGWELDGAQRLKTFLGVEFTELRYRIAL